MVLFQAATKELSNAGVAFAAAARPSWFAFEDAGHDVRHRLPGERPSARQRLVQDTAERPDVGSLVDGLPRVCSGLM